MSTPRNIRAADRILAFFEANPGEELTLDQMQVKFDLHRRTLFNALSQLKAMGEIERTAVYRAKQDA